MDGYLQRLQEALAAAIQGMSSEDLLRHPEGKWSAAEVLEHLYLTYSGTVKGCERCLQNGKPLLSPPNFHNRMAKFVVVKIGHMPGGRAAPEGTRPIGMPAEQVVENLTAKIAVMDALLGRCEVRFGARTRFLSHPVLGPLTGAEWRKFHWVHGRHHVRQILALRQRIA